MELTSLQSNELHNYIFNIVVNVIIIFNTLNEGNKKAFIVNYGVNICRTILKFLQSVFYHCSSDIEQNMQEYKYSNRGRHKLFTFYEHSTSTSDDRSIKNQVECNGNGIL